VEKGSLSHGVKAAPHREAFVRRAVFQQALQMGGDARETASQLIDQFKRPVTSVTDSTRPVALALKAGRGYVKAYVEFVHYVEGLHESVQGGGVEHSGSAGKRPER
jgi:hypothetical protein